MTQKVIIERYFYRNILYINKGIIFVVNNFCEKLNKEEKIIYI